MIPFLRERHFARWQIILGYALFALVAFVFFFYLTFPYEGVKDRVVAEARAQGYELHIRSMGPGLFGITAHDVLFKSAKPAQQVAGMPEQESQALEIESISVRPSLFPLGAAFHANALGGTASGSIGGLSSLVIDADLDELDLSLGNLPGFTGLQLAGQLDGSLSLKIPRTAPTGAKTPPEPDMGQASGSLDLEGSDVTINGGTVVVPMYGQPTPMDLPKIILGNLDAKVEFDKGQGKLETLTAKSSDLDLSGQGTVKLAKRVEYSELSLQLRFKVQDDLKKRLGPMSMALSVLQRDPKDPTYNSARVTGFLGRPNFR